MARKELNKKNMKQNQALENCAIDFNIIKKLRVSTTIRQIAKRNEPQTAVMVD